MYKRLLRVIKREKIKYPNKSKFEILSVRFIEMTKAKLSQIAMDVKKDSTFTSSDDLFMCSLFPKKVLDTVLLELKPKSVLDVGCGVGISLEYLINNNIDAWGIENSTLAISNSKVKSRIIKHNLKKVLNLNKKFDLVWCYEVIEHIHPKYEEFFLTSLMNHSDKILISAAKPGQGGHGHFNEKEPAYWIERFKKMGYIYDHKFTSRVKTPMEADSENLLYFIRN